MSVLTRRIIPSKQHVQKILSIQQYQFVRNITSATATENYEDPALATAKPFEEIPSIPALPIIGSSWVYFPFIGKYV